MSFCRRRGRRAAGERGQSTTETMIAMVFLLLLVWGQIHLSMIAATKQLVNYAAYAAARTKLVRNSDVARNYAAWVVLDATARWSSWNDVCILSGLCVSEDNDRQVRGKDRDVIEVKFRIPFNIPLVPPTEEIPVRGIDLKGVSAYYEPGEIEERGDNAE